MNILDRRVQRLAKAMRLLSAVMMWFTIYGLALGFVYYDRWYWGVGGIVAFFSFSLLWTAYYDEWRDWLFNWGRLSRFSRLINWLGTAGALAVAIVILTDLEPVLSAMQWVGVFGTIVAIVAAGWVLASGPLNDLRTWQ